MKKYIFLFLAVILFGGSSCFARAAGTLDIQFEKTPLFSEASFVPGDSVTRWVRVTNTTGSAVDLGAQLSNFSDPDGLGSQLHVSIREGGTALYSGTLSDLNTAGESKLSVLNDGAITQYDVSVTFDPTVGNLYQGKTMMFDFIIGSIGVATPTPTLTPTPTPVPAPAVLTSLGGGGGGGSGMRSPTPGTSVLPMPTLALLPRVIPNKQIQPSVSGTVLSILPQGSTNSIHTESNPENNLVAAAGSILGMNLCSTAGNWMWWITMLVIAFAFAIFGRRNGFLSLLVLAYVIIWLGWGFGLCGFRFWWAPIPLGLLAGLVQFSRRS